MPNTIKQLLLTWLERAALTKAETEGPDRELLSKVTTVVGFLRAQKSLIMTKLEHDPTFLDNLFTDPRRTLIWLGLSADVFADPEAEDLRPLPRSIIIEEEIYSRNHIQFHFDMGPTEYLAFQLPRHSKPRTWYREKEEQRNYLRNWESRKQILREWAATRGTLSGDKIIFRYHAMVSQNEREWIAECPALGIDAGGNSREEALRRLEFFIALELERRTLSGDEPPVDYPIPSGVLLDIEIVRSEIPPRSMF
jgi:predicted RNase H-like HicB family nuclease